MKPCLELKAFLCRLQNRWANLQVSEVIAAASDPGHNVVDGCRKRAPGDAIRPRFDTEFTQRNVLRDEVLDDEFLDHHDRWTFHWARWVLADSAQPVVALTDLDALSDDELPSTVTALGHVFNTIIGRDRASTLPVLGEALTARRADELH